MVLKILAKIFAKKIVKIKYSNGDVKYNVSETTWVEMNVNILINLCSKQGLSYILDSHDASVLDYGYN